MRIQNCSTKTFLEKFIVVAERFSFSGVNRQFVRDFSTPMKRKDLRAYSVLILGSFVVRSNLPLFPIRHILSEVGCFVRQERKKE